MSSDPHSHHHSDSVSQLASVLADVHVSLALATTEQESLAAVMRYIERFQAKQASLFYLNLNSEARPETADLVGLWLEGKILPEHPLYEQRIGLDQFALSEFWIRNPHELIFIVDVNTDPRCDELLRSQCAAGGLLSMVILPLYSVSHGIWQGMLTVSWDHHHALSEEERFVYSLLMQTLAAFLANRRSERALRSALDEAKLLYEVSAQLNAAATLDDAIKAAAAPAFARGAQSAFLSVVERDAQGEPETLMIAAGVMQSPTAMESRLGRRFPVREVPLAQLWLKNPDQILLISDIPSDPRVDPTTAEIFRNGGHAASVLLPLVARRRLIGVVAFAWPKPQTFDESDQRLYRAIARNAALILDNRLLMEQMERTLDEKASHTLLLKTVLEHLPVGVFVCDVPSGQPTLANRRAVEILGRRVDPLNNLSEIVDEYRLMLPDSDVPVPPQDLAVSRTMADKQIHREQLDILKSDGTRRAIDVITAPILDSSGKLTSVVGHFDDITDRKQAEHERLGMREELIKIQAAALAERSTPLIPISDEIVVVPLIGSLDTERGDQLMDALLHGVSQNAARVAIIDVTGVRTLDTQAANMLTGAAQALRLLGVEPVLTGIRAEVAQTLISIGVRLEGITTRNNLQSGIAYALKYTRRSSLR